MPRRLRLPLEVNRCALSGQLIERGQLRYTPTGIPVIEFCVGHVSEQQEAGGLRRVECEMPCVAVGPAALMLKTADPGMVLEAKGFLAARSLRQKSVVFHVTHIEFTEN